MFFDVSRDYNHLQGSYSFLITEFWALNWGIVFAAQ